MAEKAAKGAPGKQLLHLVFGGELTSIHGIEFKDLDDARHRGRLSRIMRAPLRPGRRRRSRRSTMLRCATSSCICIASSIRSKVPEDLSERAWPHRDMLKRIGRSRPVLAALGFGLASYLRLVRRTTRFMLDPPDLYDRRGQGQALHRRALAWSASDAAFHDPRYRRLHLPDLEAWDGGDQCARRAPSRHRRAARFGRRQGRPAAQGGRARDARHARRAGGRAHRRRDGRYSEDTSRRRQRHYSARQAVGSSDPPLHRGREAAHRFQHLGPCRAWACPSGAA